MCSNLFTHIKITFVKSVRRKWKIAMNVDDKWSSKWTAFCACIFYLFIVLESDHDWQRTICIRFFFVNTCEHIAELLKPKRKDFKQQASSANRNLFIFPRIINTSPIPFFAFPSFPIERNFFLRIRCCWRQITVFAA